MSDWFSWQEVSKELRLRDFELIELFPKGLQPYSPKGREKIYCPSEHHRYFLLSSLRFEKIGPEIIIQKSLENPDKQKIKKLEELKLNLEKEMIKISAHDSYVKRDHKSLSWEFFIPPKTDAGFEKLIHDLDLENAIFKRENVEEIKRRFSLGDTKKIQDKTGEQHEAYNKVFPCKPGTEWEQIEIILIDDQFVWVETPQGKGRFSYSQLDMAHKTSGKPTQIWIFLKLFATHNGNLSGEIEESVKRTLWSTYELNYNEKLPYITKRLNSHMKKLFNIQDSIYKYRYHKHKTYSTKIRFSDHTHIDKSQPPINDAEKPFFETEVEDIQNKHSISDTKRFDG